MATEGTGTGHVGRDQILVVPIKVEQVESNVCPLSPESEDLPQPQDPQQEDEYQVRTRLIAQVEKYPSIWKYGHPNYRNRTIAQETWEQISSLVRIPPEECRSIWNQIKSKFGSRRKLSKEAKDRFIYFNAMSFLEENFQEGSDYHKQNLGKRPKKSEPFEEASLGDDDMNDFYGGGYQDFLSVPQFQHSESQTPAETVIQQLLEASFKSYDKTQVPCMCIICSEEANYESKLYLHTKKTKTNISTIRQWKLGLLRTLSELVGLNSLRPEDLENDPTFCQSCHQLLLDIDFWKKTIRNLEGRVSKAKKMVEAKILKIKEIDQKPNLKAQIVIKEESHSELSDHLEENVEIQPEIQDFTETHPEESHEMKSSSSSEYSDDSDNNEMSDNIKKWKYKNRRVTRSRSNKNTIVSSSQSESGNEELPSKSKRKKLTKPTTAKRPQNNPKRRPRHFCSEPGCTFSSQTAFLLTVHVNKDHCGDSFPFHCNKTKNDSNCSEKFSSIEEFDSHQLNVHKTKSGILCKSKRCSYCEKIFTTNAALNQHIKSTHTEYQLKPKCGTCGKGFENSEQVRVHEELHYLDPIHRYACVLCDDGTSTALFQSQLDLQRHVQNFHETDLWKCPVCNLVFLTEMRLKNHTYNHHTPRLKENLKCPEEGCEFQAKTPSALRGHRYKHGDLIHKCNEPGCNVRYKWKAALNRHITTAHLKIKKWKCSNEDCGKTFATAGDMRRHEVSHLDLRPFMCEVCPSQFKWRKHLVRHKKCHDVDKQNQELELEMNQVGDEQASYGSTQKTKRSRASRVRKQKIAPDPIELVENTTEIQYITIYNPGC